MTDLVKTGVANRVMTITFNRPAQLNALSHEMYAAVADALAEADNNTQIRAVVITGAGEAFTAGNDLEDFAKPFPQGKAPVTRFLENIRDAQKPVIAAVNGPSVGVGLTMLLHCDLAFASETATLSAPFAHVGLVPEAGSSMLLPLALGNAWANDILLAGRVLSAQEALQAGLVSRVFAADALLAETTIVAEEIATLAPNAVRKSKSLIRANREQIAQRMQEEAVLFGEQLQSVEFGESVKAVMSGQARNFA